MRLIVQHVEAASVGPRRSSRLFLCATIAPFTTARDDWECITTTSGRLKSLHELCSQQSLSLRSWR